jgi:hypothetical protein
MPFGQSISARVAVRAALASMGADPVTQAVVSRFAGWTTAALTMDLHSHAAYESMDLAHDAYNISELTNDENTYIASNNWDAVYKIENENLELEDAASLILSRKSELTEKAYETITEAIGNQIDRHYFSEEFKADFRQKMGNFLSLLSYCVMTKKRDADPDFSPYPDDTLNESISPDELEFYQKAIEYIDYSVRKMLADATPSGIENPSAFEGLELSKRLWLPE